MLSQHWVVPHGRQEARDATEHPTISPLLVAKVTRGSPPQTGPGVSKPQPAACLSVACELKMVLTSLKGYEKTPAETL